MPIFVFKIQYFKEFIFMMPIFVFKIQLVYSKWVLYVGLFYLSRIFEKKALLARVNIRRVVSLLCCFLRYIMLFGNLLSY